MTKWRCVCGYIHDGDNPPDTCPKCGAGSEKFKKTGLDKSELIDRSRFTNSLHMQLFSLLEQANDIASKGIEDNLDPGCLAIFKKLQRCSDVAKRMINAEIEIHIGKGKWG